jgi:DNA repair protein RecO (recombination protein O)
VNKNPRRILLAPAYILHHQPYRDTSRILEVHTRDFGRLTVFARGVRGPKAKLASVLQPFQLVLLSWTGRGEAPQLTGAESTPDPTPLPPANLMSGFYLNELLLKLTTRHDPHPTLFDAYHDALEGLKHGEPVLRVLRIFEKRLLEEVGYGLDLAAEAQGGRGIDADSFYLFRPQQGLIPADPDAPGALAGSSLVSLAREDLGGPHELEDSRRLLQAAIAHCLEGRELATRAVARAIVRREPRP